MFYSHQQMSFDFDSVQAVYGLDEQLDEALDRLQVGASDWDSSLEERFIWWLHIQVLQDTVNVISDPRGGPKLKREAAEWLFSDKDLPFSFRSICRLIGGKASEMREKILEKPEVKKGLSGLVYH